MENAEVEEEGRGRMKDIAHIRFYVLSQLGITWDILASFNFIIQ